MYGPCTPSRLSDYVAYKSARRTRPCLHFVDIENPQTPQHPMFKEDTRTGLPIKLTGQENAAQSKSQSSPTKRKANKATGKRTGGKPVRNYKHATRDEPLNGNEQKNKRKRTKALRRTMIRRQRQRSPSHRHQSDKIKAHTTCNRNKQVN